MRCPEGKGAAFLYSVVLGIGIACIIITLLILLLQWIGGAYAADSSDEYKRGIPYDFTYYPNVEVEVEIPPDKVLRCNACVLEQYYSTTPEQRLNELRIIWDRYEENQQ